MDSSSAASSARSSRISLCQVAPAMTLSCSIRNASRPALRLAARYDFLKPWQRVFRNHFVSGLREVNVEKVVHSGCLVIFDQDLHRIDDVHSVALQNAADFISVATGLPWIDWMPDTICVSRPDDVRKRNIDKRYLWPVGRGFIDKIKIPAATNH